MTPLLIYSEVAEKRNNCEMLHSCSLIIRQKQGFLVWGTRGESSIFADNLSVSEVNFLFDLRIVSNELAALELPNLQAPTYILLYLLFTYFLEIKRKWSAGGIHESTCQFYLSCFPVFMCLYVCMVAMQMAMCFPESLLIASSVEVQVLMQKSRTNIKNLLIRSTRI